MSNADELKERGMEAYRKRNFKDAISLLQQSLRIRETSGQAAYFLGCSYLEENKQKEAFTYFQQANANDYACAAYELGKCWYYGIGTQIDEERAFDYFNDALDASGQHANEINYFLGMCYMEGFGTQACWKRAQECFQEVKKGEYFDVAQGCIAYINEEGEAIEIFRNAAAFSIEAQYWLGLLEANSYWLLKASERGHPSAMFELGSKFLGTNTATARYWLHRGASMGLTSCVIEYAKLLKKEGKPEEAANWFLQVAEKNHSGAQYMLGFYHETGVLGKKDLVAAREWYDKSAKNGNERAQQKYVAITHLLMIGPGAVEKRKALVQVVDVDAEGLLSVL